MAKVEDVGSQRNPKDNPKMLAEKFKNQSRRLPGRYTVTTGDSWTKIAEKIYGPLYQDAIKAQKMAEQLARANAKVGTLRPGTVLRVARPRRNPYLTQAFMGDTGQAPAAAPAVQGYTGPVAQTPVAPSVNYNVASTQGRPWADGINPSLTPGTTRIQPTMNYNAGSYQGRPWATGGGTNSGLPHLPGSDWAAGVINTLFGRNQQAQPQAPTANVPQDTIIQPTYLPGRAPATQPQGLGGWRGLQPVTVEKNRPQVAEPVSPYRQQLIDRGNAMDPNQVLPFTSVVDQELAAGIRPIFIYDWDAQRLGLSGEVLTQMGYIQNPMTGSWIRQGAATMPQADTSSSGGWTGGGGYSGGYSPGFRGGGGGTRGGYGGSGYTGYGGAQDRAQGYPTQAARMVREAGIGLISWRI